MADAIRIIWQRLWLLAVGGLLGTLACLGLGWQAAAGPMLLVFLGATALWFMGHGVLKSYAFTIWVLVFVAAAMIYPAAFDRWFGSDLKLMIVPLIQIIMFGMGTTLSLADFQRVFAMPWPVFVGITLQFMVMPLAGAAIAAGFGFEKEIAAGVILIGSVPGGVASNVMTYLARGNVALSVTMTACSTLVSPIMTPFLMKTLAGQLIEVKFVPMMLDICNMIIVPIVAGWSANKILYGRHPWTSRATPLALLALAALAGVLTVLAMDPAVLGPLRGGAVVGLSMLVVVPLAKLIVQGMFRGPANWMDKVLPAVSMAGICFIIAIITSRSSHDLRSVGLALIGAAMLHNAVGYLSGYWCARLARLNEADARTVAIEVGMQNGGMASALAMGILHSPKAALAPAIFGPWMNVSGSILATWWHRRPPRLAEQKPHDST